MTCIADLGGAVRTVEIIPQGVLRKAGTVPTVESTAAVHADLANLAQRGQVILGEQRDAGVMILLVIATAMPVPLTCERLVKLHGWMDVHERAMLAKWEELHLEGGQFSTTDWPGWPTLYRRRYR